MSEYTPKKWWEECETVSPGKTHARKIGESRTLCGQAVHHPNGFEDATCGHCLKAIAHRTRTTEGGGR